MSEEYTMEYTKEDEQLERIAELEKENAETQELLDKQIEATYKLDKENAELKEKLEHRNCVDCSNHGSNIKLLKAKEIIKELSDVYEYVTRHKEYADREVLAKAEQFLKED